MECGLLGRYDFRIASNDTANDYVGGPHQTVCQGRSIKGRFVKRSEG